MILSAFIHAYYRSSFTDIAGFFTSLSAEEQSAIISFFATPERVNEELANKTPDIAEFVRAKCEEIINEYIEAEDGHYQLKTGSDYLGYIAPNKDHPARDLPTELNQETTVRFRFTEQGDELPYYRIKLSQEANEAAPTHKVYQPTVKRFLQIDAPILSDNGFIYTYSTSYAIEFLADAVEIYKKLYRKTEQLSLGIAIKLGFLDILLEDHPAQIYWKDFLPAEVVTSLNYLEKNNAGEKKSQGSILHKAADLLTPFNFYTLIKKLQDGLDQLIFNSYAELKNEAGKTILDVINENRKFDDYRKHIRKLLPQPDYDNRMAAAEYKIQSEIDTHRASIHQSVDKSAARLIQRLDANSGTQVAKLLQPNLIEITRTAEFKQFIQAQFAYINDCITALGNLCQPNQQLKQALIEKASNQLAMLEALSEKSSNTIIFIRQQQALLYILAMENVFSYLKPTLDAAQQDSTLTETQKIVSSYRFRIQTAQRLFADLLSTNSFGPNYKNHTLMSEMECGLTLQEIMALVVYSQFDVEQHDNQPQNEAERLRYETNHLLRFVTHLYQLRREGNYENFIQHEYKIEKDQTGKIIDKNNCGRGRVNLLLSSLVSVHKQVEVVDVTVDQLKHKINQIIQSELTAIFQTMDNSDVVNYLVAWRNQGRLPQSLITQVAERLASTQYDISLLATENELAAVDEGVLKRARVTRTPILIKHKEIFYIYGNKKGDGKWEFTQLENNAAFTQLVFQQKTVDRHYASELAPHINQGHTATSYESLDDYLPYIGLSTVKRTIDQCLLAIKISKQFIDKIKEIYSLDTSRQVFMDSDNGFVIFLHHVYQQNPTQFKHELQRTLLNDNGLDKQRFLGLTKGSFLFTLINLPPQAVAMMIEAIAELPPQAVTDLAHLQDSRCMTLLHAFAAIGNLRGVTLLLAAGADPNARDHKQLTPMMFAARFGFDEVVALLFQQNTIDVYATNLENETAFIIACQHGLETVVQLFLARDDLDINHSNIFNDTGLTMAAWGNQPRIINLLIASGKPLAMARSTLNENALSFAASKSTGAAVSQLLQLPEANCTELFDHVDETVRVSYQDPFGRTIDTDAEGLPLYGQRSEKNTLLLLAAKSNNTDTATVLFSVPGMDQTARNSLGETAFDVAFAHDNAELFFLFRDIVSIITPSVFNHAVKHGKMTLVRTYLEHYGMREHINWSDANNPASLIQAIQFSTVAMVRLLLANGADATVIDPKNQTVFTFLCDRIRKSATSTVLDLLDIANELIQKTKPLTIDEYYWLCQQAVINDHKTLFTSLLAKWQAMHLQTSQTGINSLLQFFRDPLKQLSENNLVRYFSHFITHLASWLEPNATDAQGNTFLMQLLTRDFNYHRIKLATELVQQWIAIFADRIAINHQNHQGDTALTLDAKSHHPVQVTELLLTLAAININSQNKTGNTALLIAAEAGKQDRCLLLLSQRDIDVRHQNTANKSIYVIAQENDLEQVSNYMDVNLALKPTDADITTLLFFAIMRDDSSYFRQYLATHFWQRNQQGRTLFMHAVLNRCATLVQLLFAEIDKLPSEEARRAERQAMVNARDAAGDTALHIAYRTGAWEVVETLSNMADIDISLTTSTQQTPLMLLTTVTWPPIPDTILQLALMAAPINAVDEQHKTALFHALRNASTKIISRLLQEPTLAVNTPNARGKFSAIQVYHCKNPIELFVQLLKHSNFDVTVKNIQGETIIDVLTNSMKEKHRALLAQLKKHVVAVSWGHTDEVIYGDAYFAALATQSSPAVLAHKLLQHAIGSINQSQVKLAKKALQRALELEPNNYHVMLLLLKCESELDNPLEAQALLEKITQLYNNTLKQCGDVTVLTLVHAIARSHLAQTNTAAAYDMATIAYNALLDDPMVLSGTLGLWVDDETLAETYKKLYQINFQKMQIVQACLMLEKYCRLRQHNVLLLDMLLQDVPQLSSSASVSANHAFAFRKHVMEQSGKLIQSLNSIPHQSAATHEQLANEHGPLLSTYLNYIALYQQLQAQAEQKKQAEIKKLADLKNEKTISLATIIAYLQKNHYKEALSLCESALSHNNNNIDLLMLLSECYEYDSNIINSTNTSLDKLLNRIISLSTEALLESETPLAQFHLLCLRGYAKSKSPKIKKEAIQTDFSLAVEKLNELFDDGDFIHGTLGFTLPQKALGIIYFNLYEACYTKRDVIKTLVLFDKYFSITPDYNDFFTLLIMRSPRLAMGIEKASSALEADFKQLLKTQQQQMYQRNYIKFNLSKLADYRRDLGPLITYHARYQQTKSTSHAKVQPTATVEFKAESKAESPAATNSGETAPDNVHIKPLANASQCRNDANYQYESEDIVFIGRQLFATIAEQQAVFIGVLGAGNHLINAEAQLMNAMPDVQRGSRVMAAFHVPALNNAEGHWIAICLQSLPTGLQLWYKDSQGDAQPDFENTMHHIFSHITQPLTITQLQLGQQDQVGNVNCGLMVLKNLVIFAKTDVIDAAMQFYAPTAGELQIDRQAFGALYLQEEQAQAARLVATQTTLTVAKTTAFTSYQPTLTQLSADMLAIIQTSDDQYPVAVRILSPSTSTDSLATTQSIVAIELAFHPDSADVRGARISVTKGFDLAKLGMQHNNQSTFFLPLAMWQTISTTTPDVARRQALWHHLTVGCRTNIQAALFQTATATPLATIENSNSLKRQRGL